MTLCIVYSPSRTCLKSRTSPPPRDGKGTIKLINIFISQVPLFVQIQQKWRRMYAGECQGPGVRTDFEMVHLRKVPNQYNHLSGLLDIFKSKIAALMTLMDEESVKSGSQEERRQNPGAVSDFPPPAGREIILRTVVPRPAPYSKPLPQRMFCVLMKEDFRLAGAFSSDTSFF
ncbi:Rab3 GTPase-activating protein catalytic subunit [Acipenser ruthenus]|uniref:Rab3 GTPase-activating protein catalytic subunit n=1 Tax=Acipenser ruthenus TaxID=7906 RepID=A0A662YU09_ACIRT|nr:Rab3 GTPase-activating protein catalytic subunit [Acipenser ruthenus]